MLERETKRRKKIGNTEIHVTAEILRRLRTRVAELKPKYASITQLCPSIHAEFPEFKLSTLVDYASAVNPEFTSDFLFGLCESGQISIRMFTHLSQGILSKATRDALALKVVEKKLEVSKVDRVKRILLKAKKSHKQILLETAIMMATGEIPEHSRPELVKETVKEFGGVVGDLNDAALKFMAKLDMALDFIKDPHNVLCTPENYLDIKEKISTFKVTLKNSLSFVESSDQRLHANFKSQVITEAVITQRRIEGGQS